MMFSMLNSNSAFDFWFNSIMKYISDQNEEEE